MEETLIDEAVVEKKNEIVEHKELGMVSDQISPNLSSNPHLSNPSDI